MKNIIKQRIIALLLLVLCTPPCITHAAWWKIFKLEPTQESWAIMSEAVHVIQAALKLIDEDNNALLALIFGDNKPASPEDLFYAHNVISKRVGNIENIANNLDELDEIIKSREKLKYEFPFDVKKFRENKEKFKKWKINWLKRMDDAGVNTFGVGFTNVKNYMTMPKEYKKFFNESLKVAKGRNSFLELKAENKEKMRQLLSEASVALNDLNIGLVASLHVEQKESEMADIFMEASDDGQILFDEAEKAKQREIPTHWRD